MESRAISLSVVSEAQGNGGGPFEGDDASVDLWAARVFESLALPDARLKMRALECLGTLARRPADSIPQACGKWSVTKGTYRFLGNARVRAEALREAACASAVGLAAGRKVVLAVQDSTAFSMPGARATKGLGLVGRGGETRGFHLHSALLLDETGVAMGLAEQHTWVREERKGLDPQQRKRLPIEDKESHKWFTALERLRRNLRRANPEQRPYLVHVFDREGDIHELFADLRAHGEGFVIRSTHERAVRDSRGAPGRAHAMVARGPVLSRREIVVPRKGRQAARKAVLELRSCVLTIASRRRHTVETQYPRPPVTLSLVEAREVDCPPSHEPVRWLLWTSEPAASASQCAAVLEIYTKRWKIEEYHLILKSGCQMEALQLKTLAALEKALVLYGLVAVRILRLRDLARATPDAPCTEVLKEIEWRVLAARATQKAPSKPPTMRQAILWIGALGGHLGRKGDSMPGVRVLWQGLRDLELLVDQARIFIQHPELLPIHRP